MHALGLEDVTTERMTGDAWLFEGARRSSAAPGRPHLPSGVPRGVPGTGPAPIRGRVVHVGYGTAPEYEGLDVRGKIVFAWWDFDNRGDLAEPDRRGGQGSRREGGDHRLRTRARLVRGRRRSCARIERRRMRSARLRPDDHDLASDTPARWSRAMDRGPVRARVTLRATNTLDATGYQAIGRIRGWGDPEPGHRVHGAPRRVVHLGRRRLRGRRHDAGARQGREGQRLPPVLHLGLRPGHGRGVRPRRRVRRLAARRVVAHDAARTRTGATRCRRRPELGGAFAPVPGRRGHELRDRGRSSAPASIAACRTV